MALALETISDLRDVEHLLERADALHVSIARHQAQLLELLAQLDEAEAWRDSGYRDTASLVAGRYGITHFAASRRVLAGKALRSLPRCRQALSSGVLPVEKDRRAHPYGHF